MPVKRVLVIDDSPTERFFLTDLLRKNGYEVLAAETGEIGIAVAREQKPDLILMDVVMPGQNGFQLTRTITRDPRYAGLPVILCTSKTQETDRVWGLRQGARDYLTKPIDASDLLARIQALG